MKFRTALLSATMSVACVAGVVTAGTASAAPATPISYTANVAGDHIVFTTNVGSLRTSGDEFQVVDSAGRVAARFPLTYKFNGVALPIAASANGRSATLTPSLPGLEQFKKNVDAPTTRAERDQQALSILGSNVGTAVTIGGLIGTIIGAAVGCVITLPAGCLPGVITGAGLGGVGGTIIAGGPTLIAAVDTYFKTIRSPFVPPKK